MREIVSLGRTPHQVGFGGNNGGSFFNIDGDPSENLMFGGGWSTEYSPWSGLNSFMALTEDSDDDDNDCEPPHPEQTVSFYTDIL